MGLQIVVPSWLFSYRRRQDDYPDFEASWNRRGGMSERSVCARARAYRQTGHGADVPSSWIC
jgi:hypothetical protein